MKHKKFKIRNQREVQAEQVKELYSNGYTINEIIEETDLNYGQIQRYLVKAGVLQKPAVLSPNTRDELISHLYKKGKSAREIGKELNLFPRIVTIVFKKLNFIESNYPYAGQIFNSYETFMAFKKQLKIKVRNDYRSGKSRKDISDEYQISLQSVRNYLGDNKSIKE